MDIVREKQTGPIWKRFWYLPVILGVTAALWYITYDRGRASYSAATSELLFGEVQRGAFEVSVRGTGVLVPADVRWVSATAAGKVERVLVKPGAAVTEGQLLVQLSNPELQDLLEETQWELEALEATTQAQRVDLESRLLDQESLVLDAKLSYENAAMRLAAQSTLLERGSGAVSRLEHEQTRLETTHYQQRWENELVRLEKMRENLAAQLSAHHAQVRKMARTVAKIEAQVASLSVRAAIDGVVQEVAVEAGQRIATGGDLARLARQGDLYAELKVPELQIRNVAIGQAVLVDTRNSEIRGHVSRIDPAVQGGTVVVDVELTDALPADARPDLTVDGVIAVARIDDALYLARPAYAQSHSTMALFRVDSGDDLATRTVVQLGQGSPSHIQVLDGLAVGDRVILSDSRAFESHERIRIN